MVLGTFLLIASFVIPFFIEQSFAVYLGESATPFLSAAAFLLLISANLMQQKELNLQRSELQQTRRVLIKQRELMEKDNFENSLFNLLRFHQDLTTSLALKINKTNEYYEGKRVFFHTYKRLRNYYNKPPDPIKDELKGRNEEEKLRVIYSFFYDEHNWILVHYFKNIKSILLLIDRGNMETNYKEYYISLFVGQLSIPELQLLTYHIISLEDQELTYLVKKYNILIDNIRSFNLIDEYHYELIS